MDPKEQLRLLSKGVAEIISEEELLAKLTLSYQSKKPLRVKAGFDPSSPDIHLGHTVLLTKLRQFQDLGHEVIFIIGDATARVGDPSGRTQTRPMLSEAEINQNARTYQAQAFKILNPHKTQTVFNGKWFLSMPFDEVMKLASRITVSQLLQRDDFQKRMAAKKPVSLLELFYPLMQAFDSVQVQSDVELGGTDQKFNLLLGRELQREMKQTPQAVITLPLLVGLDGQQKMSKSLGNHVGVTDSPEDMFGKIMSLPDDLMKDYFLLLTEQDGDEIAQQIKKNEIHPKEAKEKLAFFLVERFYDKQLAEKAAQNFRNVFSDKGVPEEIECLQVAQSPITLLELLQQCPQVPSGNEARRLIKQNAVSVDGVVIGQQDHRLTLSSEPIVLKIGKRRFIKIILKKAN